MRHSEQCRSTKKYDLGAAKPKRNEMGIPVIKIICLTGLGHSKSEKISTLNNWLKSYANFYERVEFAYWLSLSGWVRAHSETILSFFSLLSSADSRDFVVLFKDSCLSI